MFWTESSTFDSAGTPPHFAITIVNTPLSRGNTSQDNRQQSHQHSQHNTWQQPRHNPQDRCRNIQNKLQKPNFIRQIIDITDTPNKCNRNSPENNQCNDKARSSCKSADTLRIRNAHVAPDYFGGFGGQGAIQLKGNEAFTRDCELGCGVGCGEGGEGYEGTVELFVFGVGGLFGDDVGVQTSEFST